MTNLMTDLMTVAPRIDARVEQFVAPVAAFRAWGDVCPSSAIEGGDVDGTNHSAADERFAGTYAWSPPDC